MRYRKLIPYRWLQVWIRHKKSEKWVLMISDLSSCEFINHNPKSLFSLIQVTLSWRRFQQQHLQLWIRNVRPTKTLGWIILKINLQWVMWRQETIDPNWLNTVLNLRLKRKLMTSMREKLTSITIRDSIKTRVIWKWSLKCLWRKWVCKSLNTTTSICKKETFLKIRTTEWIAELKDTKFSLQKQSSSQINSKMDTQTTQLIVKVNKISTY